MIVRRISNDELYHHGIKGQKWGVRRQQVSQSNGNSSSNDQSEQNSLFSKKTKTILIAAGATAAAITLGVAITKTKNKAILTKSKGAIEKAAKSVENVPLSTAKTPKMQDPLAMARKQAIKQKIPKKLMPTKKAVINQPNANLLNTKQKLQDPLAIAKKTEKKTVLKSAKTAVEKAYRKIKR